MSGQKPNVPIFSVSHKQKRTTASNRAALGGMVMGREVWPRAGGMSMGREKDFKLNLEEMSKVLWPTGGTTSY